MQMKCLQGLQFIKYNVCTNINIYMIAYILHVTTTIVYL